MKELKINLTVRGKTVDLASVSSAMESVSKKLGMVQLGESTQFNFSDQVEGVLLNVTLVNLPSDAPAPTGPHPTPV